MNNKQAYLDIVNKRKQEKIDKGDFLEIEMPSGMTWQYLPVQIAQYAVGGRLPMHLIGKLESVKNSPQKTMTEEEVVKLGVSSMEIVRDIMLNNLVSPRITLEETEDSITPEQIDPEDFNFFMQFIMRGAQADANSFRK